MIVRPPSEGGQQPPEQGVRSPLGSVLPERKRLPHEVPSWVGPGARHFITICTLNRLDAPFAPPSVAQVLLDNLLVYQQMGRWYLWLAVIMPDHLHFIATFNMDYGIVQSVSGWKRYQTRTLKIAMQSGFFEHRLRDEDAFLEKMAYVRENPVRKRLVTHAADWPYIFDPARTS